MVSATDGNLTLDLLSFGTVVGSVGGGSGTLIAKRYSNPYGQLAGNGYFAPFIFVDGGGNTNQ